MKRKKPYHYVDLKDVVCAYVEKGKEHEYFFPATKERRKFLLPWRVNGKALKDKLV